MSEDEQAEPAPNETEPPPQEVGPEPPKENPAPSSREEAVKGLRGEASELSNGRFTKIISAAADRLAGAGNLNLFHGDIIVDGDFVAGPGGRSGARRSSRARTEPQDVLKATEYFVAPPDFTDGVGRLQSTSLLVMADAAGTGRFTRALATLRDVLGEDANVYRVTSSMLGNPNWRVPHPRSGYVVVDNAGGDGKFAAGKLTDDWLVKTSERLLAEESYLVVVTGPVTGSLASASKRMEFVVEEFELPDPIEIVRRRMAGELPWLSPSELEEHLSTDGLAELLEDRDDPRFATRVASAVAEAVRTRDDVGKVVGRLSNPEDQVREWLSSSPDTADVALVLATAVLEDAGYLHVADAAIALYRQLSTSSATLTLRYLRRILAKRGWLELVTPPAGDSGVPRLRFKSAHLRVAVLGVTWFELDGARAKILEWLKSLAEHNDVEVRARTAQAAGILATNDFEHGLHKYLLPWAASKTAVLRQSAAHGLNVAGTIGGNAEAAWTHIEQWAAFESPTRSPKLPITAGLAVGGRLGFDAPRRALFVLRTLVHRDSWDLLEPVAISTKSLLQAGRTTEVLQALLEWADRSDDEEATVRILMAFSFAVLPEDGTGNRPLLMREKHEHRDVLPELWGRALADSSARKLARTALRSWVRYADQDETASSAVLDVLVGIADRGSADLERVLRLLRRWAQDPYAPSDKAAEFHDTLVDLEKEAS
ncbi:hypothetical protein SAMN04489729_8184 [Amycolatopsis lurida]|uniref:Uncharacterized protein n=1 Tax=Amycolatopsis lurida NRRL 2430 TaxID=1460371 RepID=A0A2P2FNV3_AMYLU|nr:hypothetical protein [Amycolatopsis lurida]KFU78400.1 hypothetical protein BB31_26200 [Amycolatopsis lurida NRRL 2430]SEE58085.1 hypothetical protein SAMN04489729_8184 [Amycolatopsis lurida]